MAGVAAVEPWRVDGAVPRREPLPPERLRQEAAALARDAASPWVRAQAAALALPPGLPWAERVRQGLLVEPVLSEPGRLARLHDALDARLPGPGPLAARLAAHRARVLLPGEALPGLAVAALDLLRPDEPGEPGDEGVALRLVQGRAGAGLRALGPARSEVQLVARPVTRTGLLALLAHETWPGHHLERLRARDRPHRAAAVTATPEAVVSEGLAETALRVSGRTARDLGGTEEEVAVAEVAGPLAALARADAVVLLHTRGREAAAGHLARWGLLDPVRAAAQLDFASDPRWVVHAAAYGAGARLVGRVLDAAPGVRSAHAALQRADVLPSDLG